MGKLFLDYSSQWTIFPIGFFFWIFGSLSSKNWRNSFDLEFHCAMAMILLIGWNELSKVSPLPPLKPKLLLSQCQLWGADICLKANIRLALTTSFSPPPLPHQLHDVLNDLIHLALFFARLPPLGNYEDSSSAKVKLILQSFHNIQG